MFPSGNGSPPFFNVPTKNRPPQLIIGSRIFIYSESGNKKAIIRRMKTEMALVGFDRIDIDPMGNILGYVETGKRPIAMVYAGKIIKDQGFSRTMSYRPPC